jgi:hypothetical protein
LDRVKSGEIIGGANEGNSEALGSESASTTDSVQVAVGLLGHVEVEDYVDLLNIDAATENVG